jgi:hypothetical protein
VHNTVTIIGLGWGNSSSKAFGVGQRRKYREYPLCFSAINPALKLRLGVFGGGRIRPLMNAAAIGKEDQDLEELMRGLRCWIEETNDWTRAHRVASLK